MTTDDGVPTGAGPAPDATIVRPAGDGVVVHVAGEIDLSNAARLAAVLDEALASDPARVEVDLSAVTFLGCAGVDALATARRAAPGPVIVAAPAPVRRLLAIAALAESMPSPDQRSTRPS